MSENVGITNGTLYLVPSSFKADDIARILKDGYDVRLMNDGFRRLVKSLQLDYLFIDTHPGLSKETFLMNLNGDLYYARVMPINDGQGIDWLTVVVVPEKDFMAQIHKNTRNTVLLCSAALIGVIAIGIATARWVTRPIMRISDASDKLAKGDLDQQVKPCAIAEVDTLASSFN